MRLSKDTISGLQLKLADLVTLGKETNLPYLEDTVEVVEAT